MKYKVEFGTDTEQYFELGVNWYSPMRVKERKYKIVKIFNSEGHSRNQVEYLDLNLLMLRNLS